MKNNKLKIAITIFSMLLCVGVFAQGPPGGGQRGGGQGKQGKSKPDASEILSKLDTNNDKVIDEDEAAKDKRGKISEDFDEIDANADGLIDLGELKASLNNKKPKKMSAKKLIKKIDYDGNGALNELEIAAKNDQKLLLHFKEIDTNKSYELDLEELEAFFDKNEKPRKKKRRKD